MKAIIPAAGHGTRFYPVAKSIPKEMLPIGSKPAIQLIVEEALAAGADEVIIVTSPDKPTIQRYFSPAEELKARLSKKAEVCAAMEEVEKIAKRITFVYQHEQLGLGHAILQAEPLLRDETDPILILLGDALVKSEVVCSCAMAQLSACFGNASVVGLECVPVEKLSRYGVVGGEKTDVEDLYKLTTLVEKPKPEEAPSNLAIAGRYLLHPAIFRYLKACKPSQGGEIQLTDAIQALLHEYPVYGYQYPGKRFDIGNPDGYLETLLGFNSKARREC